MYSRVRILGAPASIAAMVLQAACLGARDSVTPLGVVFAAGAINAGGDWLTVCRMNMGVLGAAAATASAEAVSMVLLAVAVWRAQGESTRFLCQAFLCTMYFCVSCLSAFLPASIFPVHALLARGHRFDGALGKLCLLLSAYDGF